MKPEALTLEPLLDIRRWTQWFRDTYWGPGLVVPDSHEKEVLTGPWSPPYWMWSDSYWEALTLLAENLGI
jgi:hypothetical protein